MKHTEGKNKRTVAVARITAAQTMLAIVLSHVLHCFFFGKCGNLILCYMFIMADRGKRLTLCQHIAGNRKKGLKTDKNTLKWAQRA